MKKGLYLVVLFVSLQFVCGAQEQKTEQTENENTESANAPEKAEAGEGEAKKEEGVKHYFNPEAIAFEHSEHNSNIIRPISTFTFIVPTFKCCPWLGLSGVVYVQRNESWSEAVLGPSVYFGGLQGGVMLGYQTEFNDMRIAPWALYNSRNEKFYFNFYYEIQSLGNDFAMRGEVYQQVTRPTDKNAWKVCFGARLIEKNIGPEINIKKKKAYLFVAPLYGWEEKTTGVAVGVGAEFE